MAETEWDDVEDREDEGDEEEDETVDQPDERSVTERLAQVDELLSLRALEPEEEEA